LVEKVPEGTNDGSTGPGSEEMEAVEPEEEEEEGEEEKERGSRSLSSEQGGTPQLRASFMAASCCRYCWRLLTSSASTVSVSGWISEAKGEVGCTAGEISSGTVVTTCSVHWRWRLQELVAEE